MGPAASWFKNTIYCVCLAALYFVAGKLGLTFASVHESASAIWPPTGIALAAILILGYRVWPGVWLGAFLVNITTAGNLWTSLGIGMGNSLEGLIGAYLVNRFANGRHAFNRPTDILKFALLAGLVSTTISATLGVTSLSLSGFANWTNFGSIWLTWWLGDAGGAFVVAPFLILWSEKLDQTWTKLQWVEALLAFFSLLLVSLLVFGSIKNYPLGYLCLVPLIWIALRFGRKEAVTANAILFAIAIWGTRNHFGPFVYTSTNESFLLLQMFMGVVFLTTMGLAAAVSENKRIIKELENNDTLREAKQAAEEKAILLEKVQAQLIQTVKMATVGQLASGIAHEINNPLQAIRGDLETCEMMLKEPSGSHLVEELKEIVKDSQVATERASEIIKGLLTFARPAPPKEEEISLEIPLKEALALTRVLLDKENIHVETLWPETMPIIHQANQQQLAQVFVNLVINAIRAMSGSKEKNLKIVVEAKQGKVLVSFQDTGHGISKQDFARIFEPFFTTAYQKGSGWEKGSGLGLSICQGILAAHRGQINVESELGRGSKFTVVLPA